VSDDTSTDVTEDAEPAPEPDEVREALVADLTDRLGDAVVGSHIDPGIDVTVRVRPDAWRTAAETVRGHLGFGYFCFLSVIDWLPSPFGRSMDSAVDRALAEQAGEAAAAPATDIVTGVAGGDSRFQVFARVAHIHGPGTYRGMTLKADVPDDGLTVDSWVSVYAGADWHEREAWEMYGITFAGHPGLRHMYLPTDFEGNPGRKDFPLLARMVKPWPGIVDVEPMPGSDDDAEGEDAS
jgi:NADH-quinone oxidoreductase subunit C